jgi:hypothetical protein
MMMTSVSHTRPTIQAQPASTLPPRMPNGSVMTQEELRRLVLEVMG